MIRNGLAADVAWSEEFHASVSLHRIASMAGYRRSRVHSPKIYGSDTTSHFAAACEPSFHDFGLHQGCIKTFLTSLFLRMLPPYLEFLSAPDSCSTSNSCAK
jgi:hypothetical protein